MKPFVTLALLVSLTVPAISQQEKKPASKSSSPLAPIEDVAGLPRVLLIGDSISIGYTNPVRKLLEGKANVHRIPTNGGPTSRGVASIDKWLGEGKWDVIHFNWGIHDLKHMADGQRQVESADYEANLRSLVAAMKSTGAQLIWASTTPIPAPPLKPERTFGNVADYNAIAASVMKENDILINDLNGWITPRFEELHKPQDLHYQPEGYAFLAEKVAAEIENLLPQP